ncbi:MAG: putative acyl-CoA dehydrogenase, partial [Acidimicrobiales bacterium]|nr:putative acyl-CoA dehydrogenase [Acidimicrobiales bacterium]
MRRPRIADKLGAMSEVTEEVRQWLDESWDPDRPLLEWRQVLADSGWGCPTWPKESYGRGLSGSQAA